MDGYPRLTERFLAPHALACRVFGCRRPVEWMDIEPRVGIGYCGAHRTRATTIPIGIFGREGEAWEVYPMSLARWLLVVAP